MNSSPRQTWDIKRFWQTVTYFEVFPLFNCLQRLFFGQPNPLPLTPYQPSTMIKILVLNALSDRGQIVVKELLGQLLPIRILVDPEDRGLANEKFGNPDNLEILDHNPFDKQVFQSIETVINCGDLSEPLLQLAKQNLAAPEKIIVDFSQPTPELKANWGAVDDVVMGGVSSSQIQFVEAKAIFSGQVSTANNGGFASVRNRNFSEPLNLSDYDGFELRIQGDGKRYKFISRCEGKWDGISYCYSFDTFNNRPQTIQIPFNQLIPVFRAKTVPEMGKFDPSSIYSIQLMYSKFEYDGQLNPTFSPGFFALEIQFLQAYRQIPRPQWIQLPTRDMISAKALLQQSRLVYTLSPDETRQPQAIALDCLTALKILQAG